MPKAKPSDTNKHICMFISNIPHCLMGYERRQPYVPGCMKAFLRIKENGHKLSKNIGYTLITII